MKDFLSGASFVINFQRSIITKVAAQKHECEKCSGTGQIAITVKDKESSITCYRCNGTTLDPMRTEAAKNIVAEFVALVETSWLAAKDAAKEERDGD